MTGSVVDGLLAKTHKELDEEENKRILCAGTAEEFMAVRNDYDNKKLVREEDVVSALDGKVVVERKQLLDLLARQPLTEAFDDADDFISQYAHWTRKLKLLFGVAESRKEK